MLEAVLVKPQTNVAGTRTETRTETKGHVVVWDLPCESRKAYELEDQETQEEKEKKIEAKQTVTNARISATNRLYTLGLGATQSCVLCPSRTTRKQIDEAKEYANKRYDETNQTLTGLGFHDLPPPDIRAIPIVETQFVEFRSIAERRLSAQLDEDMDALSKAVKSLANITDQKKKAQAKRTLETRAKKLKTTEEMAKSLGIDLVDKFAIVTELFAVAIQKVS